MKNGSRGRAASGHRRSTGPGAATARGTTAGAASRGLTPALPGVDRLDALFRGFADPTRLRILNVLAAGELCVCDVVDLLGLPQPSVSRHLAYLRRAGLVTMTREWKFAHYRLAEPAHAVHRTLVGCVRGCFQGIPALHRERAAAEVRVRRRAGDRCR